MYQYFLYRHRWEPLAGNSRYSPSYVFSKTFPELDATMVDEIVPDDKFKPIHNGKATGQRIGYVESANDLTGVLSDGGSFSIQVVTKPQAADFLRTETDLVEREPGLFVVYEAITEGTMQMPEKTIDLR